MHAVRVLTSVALTKWSMFFLLLISFFCNNAYMNFIWVSVYLAPQLFGNTIFNKTIITKEWLNNKLNLLILMIRLARIPNSESCPYNVGIGDFTAAFSLQHIINFCNTSHCQHLVNLTNCEYINLSCSPQWWPRSWTASLGWNASCDNQR